MENIFKDFYGITTFQPSKEKLVICLGAGGTGSAFIRDAARLMSVANDEGQKIKMIVCDADVVEDSNLKRQCFSLRDVGKNKAAVLATRYGSGMNVDISYIDRYIEGTKDLYEIITSNWTPGMAVYIFSFVDNVKTRLMLHNFVVEYCPGMIANLVWVDSGNSEFAGQVVAYSTHIKKISGTTLKPVENLAGRCPDVVEIKRDLLDPANWDKFASELSCEDAAIHHPQTMAANTTAANISLNMFFAMLFDTTKTYLDYNMVTFASNKNVTRTTRLEDLNFEPVKAITLPEVK